MYISEVIDDVKGVLGTCTLATCYKRISDAVRLANSQTKGFDWNIGTMDICVYDGTVTLPAEVGTVLGISVNGYPTLMRDQWFEYHINGPGSEVYTPWHFSDEMGQVSTFRDPSAPVKLVAQVEQSTDSNATLRVFGWDADGKRIYTAGPNSTMEDGFLVPCIYGFSAVNPSAPAIARIERIQKAVTNGFIKLIAVDATTLETHTKIGHYQPWETSPTYRRIRVTNQVAIRIKYRKKDVEVRGSSDWINIENREALLLLVKAAKFRLDNQLDAARNYEVEGMRLLSLEAESLRPPALNAPQIMISEYPVEKDQLFY